VDQVKFLTQPGYQFRVPFAARFPAHEKFAAFGPLEECFQIGDIPRRWAETRRALKQHQDDAERLRHGKCLVPRPANRRVETKMAAVLPIPRIDPRALVRRTGRGMRDDLPGFHGKLKIFRCRSAPAGGRFESGKLIKTGIDFDKAKRLEIFLLRPSEAAAADNDIGTFNLQSEPMLARLFGLAKRFGHRQYNRGEEANGRHRR